MGISTDRGRVSCWFEVSTRAGARRGCRSGARSGRSWAAAAIARWQSTKALRLEKERRRTADRARLLVLQQVFQQARKALHLSQLVGEQAKPHAWAWAIDELVRVRAIIDSLPLFDIPNAVLIYQLHRVDQALGHVAEIGRIYPTDESEGKVATALRVVSERMEVIDDAIEQCDAEVLRLTKDADFAF